jgi:hypothetical protein
MFSFGLGVGFETVGAVEYVNYMLLQSDPAGFMGLFEAWPSRMVRTTPVFEA